MSMSPFSNAVLSDYVVDELLTIPIDSAGNAYKKHLALLSIFPNIPIFKSITLFSKENLEKAAISELIRPNGFAGQVAANRALALVSDKHLADLLEGINNKATGLKTAKMFFPRDSFGTISYTEEKNRISISEAITKILSEQKLHPMESAYDFYILCMNLYVATRNRLIRVGKHKKGENAALNIQIDFYHLSYLPFVSELVTNDHYLREVAEEVINYFRFDKAVKSGQEHVDQWFHDLLSGK